MEKLNPRKHADPAKVADYDMRGSIWLARGNEYAERGMKAKAEQCYEKGQYWLDRSNAARGNN